MSDGYVTPRYWMNETSGRLALAVRACLTGAELTELQVQDMRAYLEQWMRGDWRGPGIEQLRRDIKLAKTSADITEWLRRAAECSIDPL